MAWIRILVDGVVHDGAGGTFGAGAVREASEDAARSLVASGYAEGCDPPPARAGAKPRRGGDPAPESAP